MCKRIEPFDFKLPFENYGLGWDKEIHEDLSENSNMSIFWLTW